MKDLFVSTNDWDSHRELLFVALENTSGSVVEFGCGHGSTPLLDKYCYEKQRQFHSFESNIDWREKVEVLYGYIYTGFAGCYERAFVDWNMEAFNPLPSILFIDCAPGELRKELIHQYSPVAEVIIVHDTEPGAEYVYGMAEVLSTFKYRLDYRPEGKPHTTAVSNTIDVSKWVVE